MRVSRRSLAAAVLAATASFACAAHPAGTDEGSPPPSASDAAAPDSPLRDTHWQLVRLGDAPVEEVEPQRAPHLVFAADAPRVSGSGGCNRITGSFELAGETLRLGPMASTMMACASGMEQEQRLLRALRSVARHRIRGAELELLDASGAPVARFEAAAPR
jgi:heat shock protein HslJ